MVWALVVGALAGIIGLTLQSPQGSMALSGWFRDLLLGLVPEGSKAARWIAANARRLGHIPEYFLLGCAMYPALKVTVPSRRNVYWAFAACLLVSLADQTLKALIPVRHFDLLDLPMDLLGYGAGILLSWGVRKKWRENE